jgi:glycosyltransferase involved in cell wall biosynthesis
MPAATEQPALSIVMPTFDNEAVLRRAVDAWKAYGGDRIELNVIEDGCRDGSAAYLASEQQSEWGRRHLRAFHEEDAHELRCTNRGFREATGPLLAAWQDDMLLQVSWLVPEIISTFEAYPDLGLLSLSRGLRCIPCDDPIARWEDLWDWKRLQSTIGHGPSNWIRLTEVDAVIRPWIVRRECLDRVGLLDDAFRPTEWDEADLAFRIREAGWKVATYGYERVGAYLHLGSTTIGTPSETYKARVLRNGLLFHSRWDAVIRRDHTRERMWWRRRATPSGWLSTAASVFETGMKRV